MDIADGLPDTDEFAAKLEPNGMPTFDHMMAVAEERDPITRVIKESRTMTRAQLLDRIEGLCWRLTGAAEGLASRDQRIKELEAINFHSDAVVDAARDRIAADDQRIKEGLAALENLRLHVYHEREIRNSIEIIQGIFLARSEPQEEKG